jgi:mutator protein MutT
VIVVVAAVIERQNTFLVTQRPAGTHLAGLWEFPGGKLEPSETHAQGLQRELREELGVEVEVGDLEFYTAHDYSDRTVALYFYRCAIAGPPDARMGQQMRWVPREELPTLGFPPADEELIRRLVTTGSDPGQTPEQSDSRA